MYNTEHFASPDRGHTPLQPLLKWPGGKSKYWETLRHHVPKTYGQFYEPFIGSAAAFLAVKPERAILGDINPQLIEFYHSLRDNWQDIYDRLAELKNSKRAYYAVRRSAPRNSIDRAVRFFYLNRTCFNGLYRTNLSGEFNVPYGKPQTAHPISMGWLLSKV